MRSDEQDEYPREVDNQGPNLETENDPADGELDDEDLEKVAGGWSGEGDGG